jgi:hypothetical protein
MLSSWYGFILLLRKHYFPILWLRIAYRRWAALALDMGVTKEIYTLIPNGFRVWLPAGSQGPIG